MVITPWALWRLLKGIAATTRRRASGPPRA